MGVLPVASFTQAVADLVELARARHAVLTELRDSESRWRSLVESSPDGIVELVRAVEDERSRMASEIHDGPVQSLSALTLRLETLRDLLGAGQVDAADRLVGEIHQAVATEITSMRRLMVDLRPPALDRLGLREAVAQRGHRFEAETGIQFQLSGTGSGRLPATQELVVFRIVQEALTNVAKHSKATKVEVMFDIAPDRSAALIIRDDGVGFQPGRVVGKLAGHMGLVAMRERAEMVGADYELRSAPGEGTVIRLHVAPPRHRAAREAGALAG